MGTANDGASEETAGQSTRRRVHIVPHTHWDREWYSSFQTFRLRLVDLLDGLLPRMEADPVVRPVPARRPARRRRRLPGGAARGQAAAAPHRQRAHRRRAPGTRSRTSSWSAARRWCATCSVACARPTASAGRDAGRLPARHVRPRRPDAPDPGRFGFEHAVVWRGVPAAIDRSGFWWEAPDGTTVRAEYMPQGYGNGSALPDDAKAFVAGGRRLRRPVGRPAHRAGPVDERHRPPDAPALAGPGGGRGQRHPGRSRPAHRLAGRAPGRRSHRGPAHLAGRAALGRPGQPADGRGVEPGRRPPGLGPGRAGPARLAPSRCRPCSSRRSAGPARCSTRRGGASSSTRPTTRCAPARSTTCATRCCTATARPPTSDRGWPTGRSPTWPAGSTTTAR